MSGPHVALDPDPLVDPLWRAELEGEWFDRGYAAAESDRRWRRAGILLAAASGLVLGIVLTSLVWVAYTRAAPRAATVIPAASLTTAGTEPDQWLPGAPHEDSRAPSWSAATDGQASSSGASQPTTEVGAAIQAGSATWCAPTPTRCQSWGGDAHLGAMQSFRFGDQPYQVTVEYQGRTTTVTVVSFCACPQTLIDLSPAAFVELAPLSRGRINVTVEDAAAGVTAPPTDVQP